jgi:hypothetical protein
MILFLMVFPSRQMNEILGAVHIIAVVSIQMDIISRRIHESVDKILAHPADARDFVAFSHLVEKKIQGLFFVTRPHRREPEGCFIPYSQHDEKTISPFQPVGTVMMAPHKQIREGQFGRLGRVLAEVLLEDIHVIQFKGLETVLCHRAKPQSVGQIFAEW